MNDQNTIAAPDTIAAIATAPGRGGVGIVRISGGKARAIAQAMLKVQLTPRYAHFGNFLDTNGNLLDQGIALFFAGPNSFTGEDVLELQGHGGPVVLNRLLNNAVKLGARLAEPGEFSQRAFLNDKIDLTQAEAIVDLIDAASDSAANNALNSLQGAFKQRIDELVERLVQLRIYVEAAIDFPEEEIDFLADGKVAGDLDAIIDDLLVIQSQAAQGAILRDGLQVAIAGLPNAGKSSLLNALSQRDTAIVTDIAGTTRDILREQILLDGLPIHISDTAGIRSTSDQVEQQGVARAKAEIDKAQLILIVIDASDWSADTRSQQQSLEAALNALDLPELPTEKTTIIANKLDLNPIEILSDHEGMPLLAISAKSGLGLAELREHIKIRAGLQSAGEGQFTARARHIDAIGRALTLMQTGAQQLKTLNAGELVAEDLRQAAETLGEITGQYTSDDLLGRIFSSFCIGK
jgi:tRNA modification GTPase